MIEEKQTMSEFEYEVMKDILDWARKQDEPGPGSSWDSEVEMIEAYWAEKLPKEGEPARVLRV